MIHGYSMITLMRTRITDAQTFFSAQTIPTTYGGVGDHSID